MLSNKRHKKCNKRNEYEGVVVVVVVVDKNRNKYEVSRELFGLLLRLLLLLPNDDDDDDDVNASSWIEVLIE